MTNLNDSFSSILSRYSGSVDDKRLAYLREYLGVSGGQINDLEYKLLGDIGLGGSLDDRLLAHIRGLGGTDKNSLASLLSSSFYVGHPTSIFQASEPGFWAEVKPSVLWQDTARTTPVTADGDPVASWQLNTSSGVIYATQTTAGNRPIYKTNGTLHWLEFDGTVSSRWLVTPTITPNTNKVQVFTGVRKLSDATVGIAVELSATIASNNGSFFLSAPAAAGASSYNFASKGTGLGSATYTNAAVAAPITNVLTGLGSISDDLSVLRVNNTQVGTSAVDQGTGNYLAYPIYIGRRGGSIFPFNGRIFGLVVRFGSSLSTAQITQVERWMGTKTGVTF